MKWHEGVGKLVLSEQGLPIPRYDFVAFPDVDENRVFKFWSVTISFILVRDKPPAVGEDIDLAMAI